LSAAAEQRDTSLNLAALDPDLAQILDPNIISHTTTAIGLTPTASPGSQKDSGFATSQSSPVRPSFLSPGTSRIPSSSSFPLLRAAAVASAIGTSPSTPSFTNNDLPRTPPVPIHTERQKSDRQDSSESTQTQPSPPLAPSPAVAPWSTPYRRPSSSARITPLNNYKAHDWRSFCIELKPLTEVAARNLPALPHVHERPRSKHCGMAVVSVGWAVQVPRRLPFPRFNQAKCTWNEGNTSSLVMHGDYFTRSSRRATSSKWLLVVSIGSVGPCFCIG
jgi:hypothetical protein